MNGFSREVILIKNSHQFFNKINVKLGIATEYPLENSCQKTKPCKLLVYRASLIEVVELARVELASR